MSRANKITFIVMFLVGAFIFWWEIRTVQFSTVLNDFLNLNFAWLAVAIIMMIASLLVEARTIQILLKDRDVYLPYRNSTRVVMIEVLFNNITPFSSGGQPAQIVAMVQSGIEAGRASSVLLMKFVIYQIVVLVSFVMTMAFGFQEVMQHFSGIAWLVISGFIVHFSIIVGLLMVMFGYHTTQRIVHWGLNFLSYFIKNQKIENWRRTLDAKMSTFYAESRQLIREKKKVLYACLLTGLELCFYYIIPYFIILALGNYTVNPLSVVTMHVMIVIITTVFPTPGGAGGAEYSFDTLFQLFLSSTSKLALGLLLWRFVTYYLGMLLGIIALGVPIKKKAKLPASLK